MRSMVPVPPPLHQSDRVAGPKKSESARIARIDLSLTKDHLRVVLVLQGHVALVNGNLPLLLSLLSFDLLFRALLFSPITRF